MFELYFKCKKKPLGDFKQDINNALFSFLIDHIGPCVSVIGMGLEEWPVREVIHGEHEGMSLVKIEWKKWDQGQGNRHIPDQTMVTSVVEHENVGEAPMVCLSLSFWIYV